MDGPNNFNGSVAEQKPKNKRTGLVKKVLVVVAALLVVVGVAYGTYYLTKQQAEEDAAIAVAALEDKITELQKKLVSVGEGADEELTEKLTVNDKTDTYSVMYPESWDGKSANVELEGFPADWVAQKGTITSPTGEVVINLETGVSGLGGACLKNDAGTIKTLQVRGVPGMQGYSIMYYSANGPSEKQNYYSAAVYEDSVTEKAKLNGTVCDVYLGEFWPAENEDNGALSFRISSKTLNNSFEKQQEPSAEQINAFFASQEFNKAVQILQTLKKS